MTRIVGNWLDAFNDATSYLPSPPLFRRWAGIACIAGVLERKIWVHTLGRNLYPNLYTILIAPPGIGKSVLTVRVEELWRSVPDQYTGATSVSKASLMDMLHEATRTIIRTGHTPPTVTFNSLKVLSNELGVFIPVYDGEFMSALTDIYDGGSYHERKRSRETNFNIERPQINFLAATTPSQLNNLLPEGAWEQGFLSRCLLIYSGEQKIQSLFKNTEIDKARMREIKRDLNKIATLFGEMKFSEEAITAIDAWHMAGGPPRPDHPKLTHYLTRRSAHLLKLCMISCVAETDSLVIEIEHYQQALDWLISMEDTIPDIFKSMSSSSDAAVMKDCWFFAAKLYSKNKDPVPEVRVLQFLQERAPAHVVERLVTVMVRAGILKLKSVPGQGTCYIPLDWAEHKVN